MNKPDNLNLGVLSRRSLIAAAFFLSLFGLAGSLTAVNGQGFTLKLIQVRVFNGLDNNGVIASERYNENGGSVEINVQGNAKYVCPGGAEKMRFVWTFGRNVSQVVPATGISATVEAGQVNASPPCSTGLSGNADFTLQGSSEMDSPFSNAESAKIDSAVFFQPYEDRNRVFPYTSDGKRRAAVIGVRVRERADRESQFAWFKFVIGTNAGRVQYVYLYEIVRGDQPSTGGCGWQNAPDPNAPEDAGRGITNWQAHYQYASGPGSANVHAFIGNRMAVLRSCLPLDVYARLYALVSVRIGTSGRTHAGWIDGMDNRAGNDPGRGISDANQHSAYVIRAGGKDSAHTFVAARLAGLRDQISADLYAGLYADLSVIIANFGIAGKGSP